MMRPRQIQSLSDPSHASTLYVSETTFQSSNAMMPDFENPQPMDLSPRLNEVVARLTSEGKFPRPWHDMYTRHSEVGCLEMWITKLEEKAAEAGEELTELPRWPLGQISTYGAAAEDPEDKGFVSACPNCAVLLKWFGIIDVNGDRNKDEQEAAILGARRREEAANSSED